MENNPKFKQKFDESMIRLQQVKDAIDDNIKEKNDFSAKILGRIEIIRNKIAALGLRVNELKKNVPNMETKVTENTGNIVLNEDNVQKLTEENAKLKQQINDGEEGIKKAVEEREKLLNDYKEKLNKFNAENNNLNAENNDLVMRGQADKEAIKNLSEQYKQEAKVLEDNIAAKEREIEQLKQSQEQLNDKIKATDAEINLLKSENEKLKTENEDLVKRIMKATTAIMEATIRLDELNNHEHLNMAELERNFNELEVSIQQISTAIQGTGAGTQPNDGTGAGAGPVIQESIAGTQPTDGTGAGAGEVTLKSNAGTQPNDGTGAGAGPVIQESNANNIGNKPYLNSPAKGSKKIIIGVTAKSYDWFINELKTKAAQITPGRENKYADVLKKITDTTTVRQFKELMKDIKIKNGSMMGGKKTKKTKKNKKNKKQKGGYIYKTNSKRKSLSKSSRTSKGYSKRG